VSSAVLILTLLAAGSGAAEQGVGDLNRVRDLQARKLELEVAKLDKEIGEWPSWLTGMIGLSAGVVGTLVSIWGTRLARHDSLNQAIHDQRLALYPDLFKATELFAIHFPEVAAPSGRLGPQECQLMGQQLSHWYFRKGGLLLSKKSRDAHLMLSSALAKASQENELRTPLFSEYSTSISAPKLARYREELQARAIDLANSETWQFGVEHSDADSAALRFRDFVFLQELSSQLRTCLTQDLRSRLRPH
jgi:hypothetical protein